MRTYEEILNTIENAKRFESLPGVEVTKHIMEKLGYPLKEIPFIHIAGTNGKGSTCAFLKSILIKAKRKVGCFTSPHLIDFSERITINDEMISTDDICRIGNMLLDMDFKLKPTMFDYCLAMAAIYFKENNCDIVIIETGLGGRLDSTNALGLPLVSIITRIGYDHMAILGNTIAEIAKEKAGIIKKGTTLIIGAQEKEAYNVISKEAKNIKVKSQISVTDETLNKIKLMQLGMSGEYQYENAANAYLAAKVLDISENIIKEGLLSAHWPGRMEVVSLNPFLLLDGAHNSNGVNALKNSLMAAYPGEKFHFVMAVMADKDYDLMIETLLPLAIDFTTLATENLRALQADALAKNISKKGVTATVGKDISSILSALDSNHKTIVFGSLYFIGDVKKTMANRK